ncbi:MAG TPA: hypothetical protein VHO72_10675 [Bacteroidales bacterium]|nr:hypothetical protein [Bacteroidales bacterium]
MIEINGIMIAAGSFILAALGYVAGKMHNAREEGKKEGVVETQLKNLASHIDTIGNSIKELRDEISSNNKAIDKRVNILSNTVTEHGQDIARIKEHLKIQ